MVGPLRSTDLDLGRVRGSRAGKASEDRDNWQAR